MTLTDDTGAPVTHYTYDAYGIAYLVDPVTGAQTQVAAGQPYLFTGRRYDYEIGLYYYRARYYSAVWGRFLQVDPVGYDGGMNLYVYGNKDPLNYVDPNGEFAWAAVIFQAAFAAVQSMTMQQIMTGEINWTKVGFAAGTALVMAGAGELKAAAASKNASAPEMGTPNVPAKAGMNSNAFVKGKFAKVNDISAHNAAITDTIDNINVSGVKGVIYDPKVPGEGILSGGFAKMGPKAFERGQGWLGSSIAHETEAHALLQADKMHWYHTTQGKHFLEAEPYAYELQNIHRFNLNSGQISVLLSRFNYHYNLLNVSNRILVDKLDFSTYWPN